MSHHYFGPDYGFPHGHLQTELPYLGAPHKARSREMVAAST
jgi:hypothetical protein